MKYLSHFGLALIMFSCILGCSSFRDQMSDYEKIADKITNRTAEKLKRKKTSF